VSKKHRSPDSVPQQRINVFLSQKLIQSFWKYEPRCLFRISPIPDMDFFSSRILTGVKKALDPGSGKTDLKYYNMTPSREEKIREKDRGLTLRKASFSCREAQVQVN
jgi:hypothetical protein